jgi:hypothetical protein
LDTSLVECWPLLLRLDGNLGRQDNDGDNDGDGCVGAYQDSSNFLLTGRHLHKREHIAAAEGRRGIHLIRGPGFHFHYLPDCAAAADMLQITDQENCKKKDNELEKEEKMCRERREERCIIFRQFSKRGTNYQRKNA